jgi:hypothetical protein
VHCETKKFSFIEHFFLKKAWHSGALSLQLDLTKEMSEKVLEYYAFHLVKTDAKVRFRFQQRI